ncbi:MAG TPA: hypothetical protein PK514_16075 [Spirochaetota bacterium]|nr:hypothetical protein [Spirochaetota bacterium]
MNSLEPSVINDAKALSESGTDKAALGETEISNKNGMVITMKPVIDAKLNAGLQLRFTLTNYESKTTITNADGTQKEDITYVTGEFTAVMAYNVLTSKIVIIVNTTAGKELVFKGGSMNGLKMGFDKLEMSFNTSSVTIGSPVAVKGKITINSVPIVIDSEIIELIMSLMGM